MGTTFTVGYSKRIDRRRRLFYLTVTLVTHGMRTTFQLVRTNHRLVTNRTLHVFHLKMTFTFQFFSRTLYENNHVQHVNYLYPCTSNYGNH